MATFQTFLLLCIIAASMFIYLTDAICFTKYIAERNKCRKIIEGNFIDAVDCCQRGGGGWSTRQRGGQCTQCSDVLDALNPEPADDPWNNWGVWGECSQDCGDGFQHRQRTCKKGRLCDGIGEQVRPCLVAPCPINGGWGNWDDWTPCSVTCSDGTQRRARLCNNPVPQHGGLPCDGQDVEILQCNERPCPIDGQWGMWSEYTPCSETCGDFGTKRRIRKCDSPRPLHGGNVCPGANQQIQICDLQPCPVHGQWSSWSPWTRCSATCDRGKRNRRRTCTDPAPAHGGDDCIGEGKEVKTCRASQRCPIHGGWSEWSEWGRCSATPCTGEEGYHQRSHQCNNPAPRYKGRYCSGNIIDTEKCINNDGCPVDGGWGPWGEWGPCSHTCGVISFQQKNRRCNNPAPQNGGAFCQGEEFKPRNCRGLPQCPEGGGGDPVVPGGGGDGDRVDEESGSGELPGLASGFGDDEDYNGSGGDDDDYAYYYN